MAVAKAREGSTPFGAVVVQQGQVIAATYNTVKQSVDPTAHAEVNAIREACKQLQSSKLQDAVLYTTCEPCPMCTGAAFFAGISHIFFGADIPTISRYLPQVHLRAAEILKLADRHIEIRQAEDLAEFEKLLIQYS